MPEVNRIFASESPVPVIVSIWSNGRQNVTPLTACCKAAAKGWADGGVVCKNCFEYVDDMFGYCWEPQDASGWSVYHDILWISGQPVDKAGEIAAHVREAVTSALPAMIAEFNA